MAERSAAANGSTADRSPSASNQRRFRTPLSVLRYYSTALRRRCCGVNLGGITAVVRLVTISRPEVCIIADFGAFLLYGGISDASFAKDSRCRLLYAYAGGGLGGGVCDISVSYRRYDISSGNAYIYPFIYLHLLDVNLFLAAHLRKNKEEKDNAKVGKELT